jgi:hypothetical protein
MLRRDTVCASQKSHKDRIEFMRLAWVFSLLLVASLATGCKQGEGDRCQLDSDCEGDLVCCVDPSQVNQGGVCRQAGKCDLTPADSGTDAITEAGEPDLEGPLPDQGPAETGTPDTLPDQSLLDQMIPDTAPAPDQKSVDTFTVDQATQD